MGYLLPLNSIIFYLKQSLKTCRFQKKFSLQLNSVFKNTCILTRKTWKLKFKNTALLTITSDKILYYKPNTNVQDLYAEYYKMLIKEIKEDLNKQRYTISVDLKIQHCKTFPQNEL